MRPMIEHFIRENWTEVAEKSLLNCHAQGLHSVMLSDTPGRRIRMFCTTKDHVLHQNFARRMNTTMSIAVHCHRQPITLVGVRGTFFNILYKRFPGGGGPLILNGFKYQSKIIDGEIGFKKTAPGTGFHEPWTNECGVDSCEVMQAHDLHTVAVEARTLAAWVVLEGYEDPTYDSTCYSNADLETENFDHLYKKPSEEQLRDLLGLYGFTNDYYRQKDS